MISLKKGETEKGAWESARGTVSDAYCAAQALLALGKDEVFQNAFLLEKCFSPNPTLCHKIQALGWWSHGWGWPWHWGPCVGPGLGLKGFQEALKG